MFFVAAENCRQTQVVCLSHLTLDLCVVTAVESVAPLAVTDPIVSSDVPVRMEAHATTSLEIVPALLAGR